MRQAAPPGDLRRLLGSATVTPRAFIAGHATLDCGCAVLIDRNHLPKHLFSIPDLVLSEDLCAEPLAGSWLRFGGCSTGSGREKQGAENVVSRQSMPLSREKILASHSISWSLFLAISATGRIAYRRWR